MFTSRVINAIGINSAYRASDFVFGLPDGVGWISLGDLCLAVEREIAGCSLRQTDRQTDRQLLG